MKFKRCQCGSETFYMRQNVTGMCDFYINCNGEEADNSGLHDNLLYKDARKYYRCANCDRRAKEAADDPKR